MPVVYVREPHEHSRREVLVDHLEGLPVKDLKEIISQRLNVPAEEQSEDVSKDLAILRGLYILKEIFVVWDKRRLAVSLISGTQFLCGDKHGNMGINVGPMTFGIRYVQKCDQGQKSRIYYTITCVLRTWSRLGLGFRGWV